MNQFRFVPFLGLAILVGCATPAPTAAPTTAPIAAPTSTKVPAATPTKRPVIKVVAAVPLFNSVSQTTWVVAKGKGYYIEEGLDIEWVVTGSGAKAIAALVGQSAHISTGAAPEVISAIAQGQPIQVVALGTVGQPEELVISKDVAEAKGVSPKATLEEKAKVLKGLKFAASSPGSGADAALRYVLIKYGIDPDRDVEISYVGLPATIPALKAGSVDATMASSPRTTEALVEGFALDWIALGRDLPETRTNAYTVISLRKDTIGSQPEISEAFVRALWRGMRFIKQSKDEAGEVFQKEGMPDTDAAIVKLAYNSVYSWHFPDSPAMTEQNFRDALTYRNKTAEGAALQVKYEDFYTPKFVEAAKKQLGF
ncbi:MAG: ABC transporter substrate-binding protein [Chloroflexi bacterium]|nr:ABC transporter substrate-binding protein [Chloroflexota bacterium]